MNKRFATTFFGRIFLHPDTVFTDEMLAPELQDPDIYAASIEVIVETHRRVAQSYLDDGTVSLAVPPLRALIEFMATGRSQEGWTVRSPELRAQFTRDSVLTSDWYAERLAAKQSYDIEHYQRAAEGLERFQSGATNADTVERLHVQRELQAIYAGLARVSKPGLPRRARRHTRTPSPLMRPSPRSKNRDGRQSSREGDQARLPHCRGRCVADVPL